MVAVETLWKSGWKRSRASQAWPSSFRLLGLRVWSKAEDMSSTDSGFESFLGAMRGAEDRHAATYYCFGTDDKDKLVNPAETFNQFLKDAPKPGGKGDGKGK